MLEMNISFDFFMSQVELIKQVKDNEKTSLSIVLYKPIQSTCILRVCKDRDLTSVCESLSAVRNPNVAYVYDYVYANGNTYIIEEKLSGDTVEALMSEKGVFSEEQTAEIITSVCDGLSELHKLNPPLIHNDINPSNIMICDDSSIKLFDFDISRIYKKDSQQNTVLFGTEEYASPEHFGYGQSEPRSDIYCLGVTMHKMLTGKYLSAEHKSVYNGRLKSVIEKCIEIDPKNRYALVEHLKKDLNKATRRAAWLWKVILTVIIILLCLGCFVLKQCNGSHADKNAFDISSSSTAETSSKHTSGITSDTSEIVSSNQDDNEAFGSDTSSINQSSDGYTSFDNSDVSSVNGSSALSSEGAISEPKDPATDTKNKKVVSKKVNGETRSMVVLNNGVLVYLEDASGEYHIKTFSGADTVVAVPFSKDRCVLLYDNYRNKLYIVATDGEKSSIYLVNSSFQIQPEPLYTATRSTVMDIKGSFFSDGVLYCDAFQQELIDTEQWSPIGKVSTSGYMVANDNLYHCDSAYLYKMDDKGSVICNYAWPKDCRLYNTDDMFGNNECLYFEFTKNGKDYIYSFSGTEFKELLCLNDYKYYTSFGCKGYAISDSKLWMYDPSTSAIKEISIK